MFQIVTLAGVNPQFVLFTHFGCSRGMQALAALGGEQHQANSPEELANLLNSKTGAVVVPLFDFTSHFDRVRRHCRFVRRSGKAHFPNWVPNNVDTAIRIYSNGTDLSVEALRQFDKWRSLPPRVLKHKGEEKRLELYGMCHGYCH